MNLFFIQKYIKTNRKDSEKFVNLKIKPIIRYWNLRWLKLKIVEI